MYRSCIFCSADLKGNDALERFPVGRSIAFDGEKGRLWAVCPRCARWNLAPIEERWEAIADAERLFRDTRTRVHSDNVGLAKLRDGTRLIRIGQALSGELAAWRYGSELGRRRRKAVMAAGTAAVGGAILVGSVAVGVVGVTLVFTQMAINFAIAQGVKALKGPEVHRFPAGTLLPDEPVYVDRAALLGSSLVADPHGGEGIALHFPRAAWGLITRPDGTAAWGSRPATLSGADAHRVLRRGLISLNARGASRAGIADAVGLLVPAGAGGFLDRSAAERVPLVDRRLPDRERRARLLAVEMALHEETERRALDGELAALEEMWRQAEEIAAIVDRLDHAAHHPAASR